MTCKNNLEGVPASVGDVCNRNTEIVIPTKGIRQCPSCVEATRAKNIASPAIWPKVKLHAWVVHVSWKRAKLGHKVMGQAKREICLSQSPSPESIKQIPRRPSGFVGMTGYILFSKVPRRATARMPSIGMTGHTRFG